MLELLKQYIENKKQIDIIHEVRERYSKMNEKEIADMKWNVYRPKIRALQDERDAKEQQLLLNREAMVKAADESIEVLHVTIAKVNHLLGFFKLNTKKDLEVKDETVRAFHDAYVESLGHIFNDEFLKIKLFIVENSKPKNKMSLVAVGKCLFDEELTSVPHGYGIPLYVREDWHNVEVVIKDLPTKEELREHLKSRKKTILSWLLAKYESVKQEYLACLKTYELKDFEKLIRYRCKCGFFYSIREISRMSVRGDGVRCSRCGEMMKENRDYLREYCVECGTELTEKTIWSEHTCRKCAKELGLER